jgi:hypothetical protein
MILFDRRLGAHHFNGFFGVSLINEAGRWRAVIARGMKSSAGQTRHWVRGFALPFQIFPIARPVRYGIATLSQVCCGTM